MRTVLREVTSAAVLLLRPACGGGRVPNPTTTNKGLVARIQQGKATAANLLVVVGGQERTEREYDALLDAAGFDLAAIIPTRSPLSLIEGAPV